MVRHRHKPFKWIMLGAVLAIGLLLQACVPKPGPQQSCNFTMSSDQQRISWGAQTPVVLYVDGSVPAEFFDSIRSAVDHWNQSVGREVLKIGGWSSSYPEENQDGVNVIYWKKSGWTDSTDKQAVTTIYWAADRLFEADVRINDVSFDYFAGPTAVPNRVDFESLILHELGHVLGLSHQEVGASVMAMRLENAVLRRAPSQKDIDDVKCEY